MFETVLYNLKIIKIIFFFQIIPIARVIKIISGSETSVRVYLQMGNNRIECLHHPGAV